MLVKMFRESGLFHTVGGLPGDGSQTPVDGSDHGQMEEREE
jgi:hypothetical protein